MITLKDKTFVPFLSEEDIVLKVHELGRKISVDYKDKEPVLLGVLNGSFMFLSDLAKQISIHSIISFIKIASYEGDSSTGIVRNLIGLQIDLKGRDIIIVEDIVDTGLSMTHLLELLEAQQPASIRIVTLLFKPKALKYKVTLDYVGFEIPNKFVVGYGLDYDGLGRNLPEIYQLKI